MNRWQRPPKYIRDSNNIFNTKRYLGRITLFVNKVIVSNCLCEMFGPLNSKKLDKDNILFSAINLREINITCDGSPTVGGVMSVWTWDEIISNKTVNKVHIKIYK